MFHSGSSPTINTCKSHIKAVALTIVQLINEWTWSNAITRKFIAGHSSPWRLDFAAAVLTAWQKGCALYAKTCAHGVSDGEDGKQKKKRTMKKGGTR